MRKCIFIFCIIVFSIGAQAQDHLSVKGIPLGSSLSQFINQLKSKGFREVYSTGGDVVLTGDFAGRKDCLVTLWSTPKTQLVWMVIVSFPPRDSWEELKKEYDNWKKTYTEKYGVPESIEWFAPPYTEGDGQELMALTNDKCNYHSFYENNSGKILVTISSLRCVQVVYEDSLTFKKFENEGTTMIYEDI